MELESEVARHYTRGGMLDAVLGALRTAGKDPDNLHGSDLFGADELHIGWQPATADLAQDLKLSHGMKVLDVGAGVGGPARYLAEEHGAQVTGIDLSQEFVDVATELTRRCGLSDRASFRVASGLDMPFEEILLRAVHNLEAIAGEAAHDLAQRAEMILGVEMAARSLDAEAHHVPAQAGERPFVEEAGQVVRRVRDEFSAADTDEEMEIFPGDIIGGGCCLTEGGVSAAEQRVAAVLQTGKTSQDAGIGRGEQQRGEEGVFVRAGLVDVVGFRSRRAEDRSIRSV